MNRSIRYILCLTVCLLCLAGPALGQDDQPSLDDLLDLSPNSDTPPAQTDQAPDEKDDMQAVRESVDEALTAAQSADTFERAIGEMDQVARRLGRSFDAGIETQRMQESIMRKLDQVIESAQQQNNSGNSSSSGEQRQQDSGADQLAQQSGKPKPGQPNDTSTQASPGSAGVTQPIDPQGNGTSIEQLRKEWGELPPRTRKELNDGLHERFSPLYRRMTEAYYKALAEQE